MSKVTPLSVVYLDILALVLTQARYALSSPVPPSGRIYNGTEIEPPHKYPFLAAIYDSEFLINGEYRPEAAGVECGASVVAKHWVVTAAHCCRDLNVTDIPIRFVVVGLHNQSAFSPWSQNLSISECIKHNLYNLDDITHDIALVRVKGTIIFNDKVTPMNLPPLGFEVTEDGETKAQAMGWGQLANRKPPMVPNEVDLPLVTLDTCQRIYGYLETSFRNDTFNASLVVLETNLCAGDGILPKSTCSGDSGGPLVTYNSDKGSYTQVGITSWSEYCSREGHYAVFSNVAKYINWIKNTKRYCTERIINKAHRA